MRLRLHLVSICIDLFSKDTCATRNFLGFSDETLDREDNRTKRIKLTKKTKSTNYRKSDEDKTDQSVKVDINRPPPMN